MVIEGNNYTKINIIGDLHACYEKITPWLTNINSNELYVFLGNYINGPNPINTFNFLNSIKNNKNIIFLTSKNDLFIKEKLLQLNCGFRPFVINSFKKLFKPYIVIKFHNKLFYVHNGCTDREPNFLYSEKDYINGTKINFKTSYIEKLFCTNVSNKMIQIHGGRNNENLSIRPYKNVLNLEGNPHKGGGLRIVTFEYKNRIISFKSLEV